MPSFRPHYALALASVTWPAFAADPPTLEDLGRRLEAIEQRLGTSSAPVDGTASVADLDQRLRVLERKLELQADEAASKAATAPVVSLDEKGLAVRSAAPGAFELKLRGLVQGDGRFWIADDAQPQNDTFLLRRIEPTLEGSWGSLLGFRLTGQFAGDSATINDAYLDLKFDPRATVRIGKTKTPVGLERLQSSASTEQVELGFPSELAPGRDVGVQLQGQFPAGVSYALGMYNGTADGRDGQTTNPDGDFDVVGRVFFEPWKGAANALSGLGFGVAASRGERHGTGSAFLPRYRTPGQATFFGYRSDVAADGAQERWSPQAYYYNGPFGLLGEYIVSRQEVVAGTGERAELDNRAWQLSGGIVLTGEDASYQGVVRPDHPFTLAAPGWGALELVARYGRLEIDDDAFPLFADPMQAMAAARGWGLGLNWVLTRNLKLTANYTRTAFDAAPGVTAREDEQVVFTRAQFSF